MAQGFNAHSEVKERDELVKQVERTEIKKNEKDEIDAFEDMMMEVDEGVSTKNMAAYDLIK